MPEWRHTSKPVRFFFFDAKAVYVLALFLLHMRTWTFCVCVAIFVGLWVLEKKGLTIPAFLRTVRCYLACCGSQYRPALPSRNYRRLLDYHAESGMCFNHKEKENVQEIR